MYIGETEIHQEIRIKEHAEYQRLENYGKTKLVDHLLETKHNVRYNDVIVMGQEMDLRRRRFCESICIEKEEAFVFNYRDSLRLDEWLKVMAKYGK